VTQEVSYWVAAHLTGIFQIKDESDEILARGSRGAGISINRGVLTTVSRIKSSTTKYFFDGLEIGGKEASVSSKVVEMLVPEHKRKNLRLDHKFEIPVSSGYGASAAGAVGSAFAFNDFLELGFSEIELLQIAHKAEILTKSGLGDVIALYQGGLELRLKEGAPGYGTTRALTTSNNWNVATVQLGPLVTSTILSDPQKRQAVNKAGEKILKDLILNPTFDNFIHKCSDFTRKANLWSSRLKKYIMSLPKEIVGAQIMLGESFFLFYHDEKDLELLNVPQNLINKETICNETVVKCK
jgi:pantoate kinase